MDTAHSEMQKIRICYVARSAAGVIIKGLPFGGAEILSLNEAKELAKDRRFDVHFLIEGKDFSSFRQHNLTIWVIRKTSIFRDIFTTWRIFRKINADVYFQRVASSSLQMVYESIICRLMGKGYVMNELVDPMNFINRSTHTRALYKTALYISNAIVAHSKMVKTRLRMHTRRFIDQINHSTTINKPVKAKRKHILWVGRANPLKRPEIFIELAKRFPKESFLMITAGKLNQQAPANLKILYDVPNKEIDRYYATAKMVVQTTASEGFGTVFLEAWKNRTPVVSLTVDPDGVIEKYKAGLHSKNFEQMTKDVRMLLTNKSKCGELSENGHKYVKENHDVKIVAEKYKELFLSINRQKGHARTEKSADLQAGKIIRELTL